MRASAFLSGASSWSRFVGLAPRGYLRTDEKEKHEGKTRNTRAATARAGRHETFCRDATPVGWAF
jgi:hypothetical protein